MVATPDKAEQTTKRGRGRPRVAEYPSGLDGVPDVGSMQQSNVFYSWRATGQLGDDPRRAWLFNGPGGRPRTGILAELGRVNNLAARLDIALHICREAKCEGRRGEDPRGSPEPEVKGVIP
jgi:hypothetical protein